MYEGWQSVILHLRFILSEIFNLKTHYYIFLCCTISKGVLMVAFWIKKAHNSKDSLMWAVALTINLLPVIFDFVFLLLVVLWIYLWLIFSFKFSFQNPIIKANSNPLSSKEPEGNEEEGMFLIYFVRNLSKTSASVCFHPAHEVHTDDFM